MAINKNHEFEDLDGIKCSIVEKNSSAERVEFLKKLLEYNHYTVVVVKSPPPKAATPAVPTPTDSVTISDTGIAIPEPPTTFTIGVTDVTFNSTNAIMGRLLRAPGGHVVTLDYWLQKEKESHDEIPYFEKKS
jgi:hypothetical protein